MARARLVAWNPVCRNVVKRALWSTPALKSYPRTRTASSAIRSDVTSTAAVAPAGADDDAVAAAGALPGTDAIVRVAPRSNRQGTARPLMPTAELHGEPGAVHTARNASTDEHRDSLRRCRV